MPTCLLHVPKAAGTSMRIAIQRALPHGALAPWHSEPAIYADFSDFAAMKEPFRSTVATDEWHISALRSSGAVVGHFTLPTLLRVSAPPAIGTVLREPRSRLLSMYTYWRLTPGLAARVAPYHVGEQARRPLEQFLAEPRLARVIDNQLCRLLLFGDERLPDKGFIAAADAPALADAASEKLDELGFVGIVEREAETWDGVGRLFGVPLERLRMNVSGAEGVAPGSLPVPAIDADGVLESLAARCAADGIVYRRVLASRCGSERAASRLADATFAAQLVRFGNTTGESAALLAAPDTRFDTLRSAVEDRDREIARLHAAVAERDDEIARLRAAPA